MTSAKITCTLKDIKSVFENSLVKVDYWANQKSGYATGICHNLVKGLFRIHYDKLRQSNIYYLRLSDIFINDLGITCKEWITAKIEQYPYKSSSNIYPIPFDPSVFFNELSAFLDESRLFLGDELLDMRSYIKDEYFGDNNYDPNCITMVETGYDIFCDERIKLYRYPESFTYMRDRIRLANYLLDSIGC